MSISHEDVNYVAKLAKLKFGPDEIDRYAGQLSSIISHIDKISQLDLKNVEPTSHVLKLSNVFREDLSRPSLAQDEALSNGPDIEEGAFRVPPILDTGEPEA